MEPLLSILIGLLFAIAVYLMLSPSLVRILLGIFVLSNAANLTLFTAGRLTRDIPPLIAETAKTAPDTVANPLPQALILTAIVISFGLFAFLLVLGYRAYQALGTVDTNEMDRAEPRDRGAPETQL